MFLKIKKHFKPHHFIYLGVILLLLFFLVLAETLPLGPGDWNQRQINKIKNQLPSPAFSFAVFGDVRDNLPIFKRILKNLDQKNHSFAVVLGDLVSHGRKDEYRIFYNLINKTKTPILTAVGNHDVKGRGQQIYTEIFGPPYYSFSLTNCLFIILDDSDTVGLDHFQSQWLESQLQKDFSCKFVFLHVPPFDPRPWRWHALSDRKKAQEFMGLMEKYRPTAVFTGHIHGHYDLIKNGVNYLITGGGGSPLITDDPEHAFYHYLKISVDGQEIKKEVILIPSLGVIDKIFNFWLIYKLNIIILGLVVIIIFGEFFFFFKKQKKFLAVKHPPFY